jgi:hypothetical protein
MKDKPWLDKVRDSEDSAKKNAEAADNNICDSQKRVSASNDRASSDHDRFRAFVFRRWENWWMVSCHIDLYKDAANLQSSMVTT